VRRRRDQAPENIQHDETTKMKTKGVALDIALFVGRLECPPCGRRLIRTLIKASTFKLKVRGFAWA
jgi:hypothetical protein